MIFAPNTGYNFDFICSKFNLNDDLETSIKSQLREDVEVVTAEINSSKKAINLFYRDASNHRFHSCIRLDLKDFPNSVKKKVVAYSDYLGFAGKPNQLLLRESEYFTFYLNISDIFVSIWVYEKKNKAVSPTTYLYYDKETFEDIKSFLLEYVRFFEHINIV